MLRRNECRLNFKNRPVRTGDIKGGPKQPPPLPLIGVARSLPLIGLIGPIRRQEGPSSWLIMSFGGVMGPFRGTKDTFGGVEGLLQNGCSFLHFGPPLNKNPVYAPAFLFVPI